VFAAPFLARTRDLVRGVPRAQEEWVLAKNARGFAEPLALLVAGSAAYGWTIGLWHGPLHAAYVAVKLPLLLVATALLNAVLNALWARRLQVDLSFGELLRSVLLAFALAAVVLGSFTPVVLFLDVALPGVADADAHLAHNVLGLAHVALVAWVGIQVVRRQIAWLEERAAASRLVVSTWLAMNLLVGAQLSWNLRPWFGTPGMGIEFLRPHPFDGSFYESIWKMLVQSPR
jgi:hypothetical protein